MWWGACQILIFNLKRHSHLQKYMEKSQVLFQLLKKWTNSGQLLTDNNFSSSYVRQNPWIDLIQFTIQIPL